MHLKPLDWTILRELMRWEGNQPQGSFRLPVADIARRTGHHPNTVRNRLKALQEGGVVEGAVFEPWPRTVGLVKSGWLFRGVGTLTDADVAQLFDAHQTAAAAVLGLDWLFLHFWERTDEATAASAQAMARQLEAASLERHFTSSGFPPVPADRVTLSDVDRRLVVALRQGSSQSMAQVAASIGLTQRTAERRAALLFSKGAGGMFPCLRVGRIEGETVAHFLVRDGDHRAPASLAQAFPDRLVGPWGGGVNAGIVVAVPNLAAAVERQRSAQRLPGIARLEVLVYRDTVFSKPFDAYLAGIVASSQPAVALA